MNNLSFDMPDPRATPDRTNGESLEMLPERNAILALDKFFADGAASDLLDRNRRASDNHTGTYGCTRCGARKRHFLRWQ